MLFLKMVNTNAVGTRRGVFLPECFIMNNINTNITNGSRRKTKRRVMIGVVIVFWLAVFFIGGFGVGKITTGKIKLNINSEIYKETELPAVFDNTLMKQVWTIIKSDFVDQDKIDDKKLFYGALEGFVNGLGDEHSFFLDPKITEELEMQIAGEFEGIGAQVSMKEGVLTVVAPIAGSPAEKVGLKPGDFILAVDGQDVVGMALDKAVRLIRGPKGTEVKLSVVSGEEDPKDISIKRDKIEMKSVEWKFRDDGLAYVAMTGFHADTTYLFNKFIKEYKNQKAKGLILDLRNNPGGLLDQAVNISSAWIENDVVVVERMGSGQEILYNAAKGAPLKGVPTVILVNAGSASGSEIVAGAFKDYKIGQLVGEKTFGKGSVQNLKKLPDGSSVKITVAKWLTPNRNTIEKEGIVPDVEVKLTKEDYEQKKDPQLDKAVELLRKK